MAGSIRLTVLGALALGSASALQIPLQLPIQLPKLPWASSGGALHGDQLTSKPTIDSEALQNKISVERLQKRAEDLYEIAKTSEEEFNRPTRAIGTQGHSGTLAYIRSALADLDEYYTVSTQDFSVVSGSIHEHRLILNDKLSNSAQPLYLSPPTHNNQPVFGKIVLVKNEGCQASDFPDTVDGNIAFIIRGRCSFAVKSSLAGKAGATAAVIYNQDEDAFSGTLEDASPDHVPSWSLSGKEGKPIADKLKHGQHIDAIAYMDSVINSVKTTNVIAQTVGGDPDNCVVLGGHSDSVTAGPGINDDGTGSISVLEIAVQLTNFKVNNCVRFAWWAAEELGLLGSNYYVSQLSEEENKKVRLFMDYDMMASPNFAYQIYNATNDESPAGSEELRDLYVDWYEKQGLNYTFIPFDGRSDYDGFIRASIPAGGIATGAEGVKTEEEAVAFGGKAGDWYDPCYHQLCDDLSNVNYTAWEVNTKLIAHSVATYARSFKGFPERSLDVRASGYEDKIKYRGPRLFI